MPKLYFRHGTVMSAKSMQLLAIAHTYESQGKKVIVCKPKLDTKNNDMIQSRSDLKRKADVLIESIDDIKLLVQKIDEEKAHCILSDEAQFYSEEQIDEFAKLTKLVPVMMWGLRTDFKTQLFAGSKRLLELADNIEEIKTTCYDCGKKAIFSQKRVNGCPVFDGEQIEISHVEIYLPKCREHYYV